MDNFEEEALYESIKELTAEVTRLRVLLATAKKALELVKMHANPDMDNHVQYYDIACCAIKEIGGDA